MKHIPFILLLIYVSGCTELPAQKTGREGQPLPSFNVLLADSLTRFNTATIPRGKPVVLFDYGPDCPYSRAQMQEIIDEMGRLKDIQFLVTTIWPLSDMKRFSDKYQLYKYRNITTGIDYTNFFGSYFKATGVPGLAIYGKDKRLIGLFVGKIPVSQIKRIAER